MRSAAASVRWIWFEMLASCVIGCVKLRSYWMNAWMPPTVIVPPAAIDAPRMQTTT